MYYLGIRVVENKGSLCKSAKVPIPLGIGYVYVEGLDCPVVRQPFHPISAAW